MKQTMLFLFSFFLGVVAGRLSLIPSSTFLSTPQPSPALPRQADLAMLTIERVRELAELTALAVDVADVQQTSIHGRVGGIEALIVVKGEVRIATDLNRARFESMDPAGKTAVLVLDPPAVSIARLDHEHTRLFAVNERGLWLITPGDLLYDTVVNRAFTEAQRAVADAGNQPELLEKARRETEQVLGQFCESLGWHVTIRWSDSSSIAAPQRR